MGRVSKTKRLGQWDQIRLEYEDGARADELAQKWAVKASTIRSRATRENWATPHRVKKAVDAVVELVGGKALGFGGSVEPPFQGQVVEDQSTMTGLQRGPLQHGAAAALDPLEYQRFVAEMAMQAVRSGLSKVKRPGNWREIATADTIARRAAGLDKDRAGGMAALIRIGPGAGPVDVAMGVSAPDPDPEDWGDDAE